MSTRILFLCMCVSSVFGVVGSTIAAPTITYDYAYDATNDVLTTPYSGMLVETFDSPMPAGWARTGGAIVSGSVSGEYAAPYNSGVMTAPDATNYLTVPVSPAPSGSASFTFGDTHDYLGLFWGSMDSYNTIDFLNNNFLVASYTGDDLTNPADGNQSAPSTNVYVNFLNMPVFDEVVFSSSQYAFEIDNVAVGTTPATVPAPGALVLAGLGTGLVRLIRKRHCV